MKISEKKISFFESVRNIHPVTIIEIGELLDGIQNGRWEKEVLDSRLDPKKKINLPCYTPTGIFTERRLTGIKKSSGIICLDIDGVEYPDDLKMQCAKIPWVLAAFVTPSGQGLKIFVPSNASAAEYKEFEAEIALSFYKHTGFMRDQRAKNLAQVHYVSFDKTLYINSNSIFFEKRSR